jgi:hypothetical protein
MRRFGIFAIVGTIAAGFVFQKILGGDPDGGRLVTPQPTAILGSGGAAVGVSADGKILHGLSVPEGAALPRLPLSTAPAKARLAGPLLEQARVLGAAPAALRPHVAGSSYGESGVNVELRSGIELRFGSASRAADKWRAAAAVFADPSVTALDYVSLHSPEHPAVGGSGHTLPALP